MCSSDLPYAWKGEDARRHLCARLRVGDLDGFGIGRDEDHLAIAAAAALRYAEGTLQVQDGGASGLAHVRALSRLHHADHLVLDATCRRNLDLLRNSRDGGRAGTLLATVDRTRTAPGARLLAEWLTRPLATVAGITARQDAVAWLVAADAVRTAVRAALGQVYDLERLLARIATGRANARDLVHLAGSLEAAAQVATALPGSDLPPLLAAAVGQLVPAPDLVTALRRSLVEDPPLAITEAGLIRDGVDAQVDEYRLIKRDAGAWLADYQAREAAACGLAKLKVGYNKVFGYYIEISKANGDRVPAHFIRKQTLVGAERYITPELKEYEDKALGAEERLRTRELAIFQELRAAAEAVTAPVQICAQALALVDVLAGLSELARLRSWCRPLVDDSHTLELTAARHPVVEEVVGAGRFVGNDCFLTAVAGSRGRGVGLEDSRREVAGSRGRGVGLEDSRREVAGSRGRGVGLQDSTSDNSALDTAVDVDVDVDAATPRRRDPATEAFPAPPTTVPSLAIITGPNMAGKSTYIRQVALLAILAQAGSFVPATTAHIGVVDRVFTRVGAGDELARGQSTFMVEMAETAAILHHATRRSLVVLDEVGRGTSTFDGVSLAWAIVEHLHDRIGCRALFATHYHELTDLADDRPGITNLTVAVAEQDDDVVFLHRIEPGAAAKSYGIHVARLAGVPGSVVRRAREVLATLEQLNVDLTERERPTARANGPVQLTLFAPASATLERLKASDLDALSPRQAQDLLYDLQAAARRE